MKTTLGLACALGAACVYDASDRCGPHQRQDESGFCVCVDGAVPAAAGGLCDPCPTGEIVRGGKCDCPDGFVRPTSGGACMEAPLGASCELPGRPCKDATYSTCRPEPAGAAAGYCTNACSTSADCQGGYACDTKATPGTCKRPPLGQGKTCMTAADCAGTEATYCEFFSLRQCLVEDCKLGDPGACFAGYTCCDLTAKGLAKRLCLPTDTCPQ